VGGVQGKSRKRETSERLGGDGRPRDHGLYVEETKTAEELTMKKHTCPECGKPCKSAAGVAIHLALAHGVPGIARMPAAQKREMALVDEPKPKRGRPKKPTWVNPDAAPIAPAINHCPNCGFNLRAILIAAGWKGGAQ
jgi:hypothetical protein